MSASPSQPSLALDPRSCWPPPSPPPALLLQPLATGLRGLFCSLQQGAVSKEDAGAATGPPVCHHSGRALHEATAGCSLSQASHHSRPAATTSVKGIFQALHPHSSRPHCPSTLRASDTQGLPWGVLLPPPAPEAMMPPAAPLHPGRWCSGPPFSSWTI